MPKRPQQPLHVDLAAGDLSKHANRAMSASFRPDLFADKTAVVLGGTSGIGAASALMLAELGARVKVLGLFANGPHAPRHERIDCTALDVRQPEDTARHLDALRELDVLINAAGVSLDRDEYEADKFDEVMRINLGATMHACTRALPALAQRSGSVVNIASMYSTFGSADRPAYAASKGAVVQLTKSLAQAYASVGVRVNAVAPGWIRTPLSLALQSDGNASSRILGRTPLGRWGEPAEVAAIIVFLCSSAASFITGATVPVDGGYLTV